MPDLKDIERAVRQLANKRVLIGIPLDHDPRPGAPIGNAALGYIHEFGSPARNIPARPHLRPGVERALPEITRRLQAAGQAALAGNTSMVEQYLGQAGAAAVNSVQQLIRSKLAPPIQPESYLGRTTGRAARRQRARQAGVSLIELARAEAAAATPLIDTADYSSAITWVIRDRRG